MFFDFKLFKLIRYHWKKFYYSIFLNYNTRTYVVCYVLWWWSMCLYFKDIIVEDYGLFILWINKLRNNFSKKNYYVQQILKILFIVLLYLGYLWYPFFFIFLFYFIKHFFRYCFFFWDYYAYEDEPTERFLRVSNSVNGFFIKVVFLLKNLGAWIFSNWFRFFWYKFRDRFIEKNLDKINLRWNKYVARFDYYMLIVLPKHYNYWYNKSLDLYPWTMIKYIRTKKLIRQTKHYLAQIDLWIYRIPIVWYYQYWGWRALWMSRRIAFPLLTIYNVTWFAIRFPYINYHCHKCAFLGTWYAHSIIRFAINHFARHFILYNNLSALGYYFLLLFYKLRVVFMFCYFQLKIFYSDCFNIIFSILLDFYNFIILWFRIFFYYFYDRLIFYFIETSVNYFFTFIDLEILVIYMGFKEYFFKFNSDLFNFNFYDYFYHHGFFYWSILQNYISMAMSLDIYRAFFPQILSMRYNCSYRDENNFRNNSPKIILTFMEYDFIYFSIFYYNYLSSLDRIIYSFMKIQGYSYFKVKSVFSPQLNVIKTFCYFKLRYYEKYILGFYLRFFGFNYENYHKLYHHNWYNLWFKLFTRSFYIYDNYIYDSMDSDFILWYQFKEDFYNLITPLIKFIFFHLPVNLFIFYFYLKDNLGVFISRSAIINKVYIFLDHYGYFYNYIFTNISDLESKVRVNTMIWDFKKSNIINFIGYLWSSICYLYFLGQSKKIIFLFLFMCLNYYRITSPWSYKNLDNNIIYNVCLCYDPYVWDWIEHSFFTFSDRRRYCIFHRKLKVKGFTFKEIKYILN